MDSQNISNIEASVCRKYLLNEFNNYDFKQLTKRAQEVVSTVNILLEFLETGAVQIKKVQINLDGPIGALMSKYLVFKTDNSLNIKSINLYERHLSIFLHFLKKNGVEVITSIRLHHIQNYIKNISPRTITTTRHLSEVLRMLNPFPSEKLNAFPVSDLVDNPGKNDVSMLHRVGERLQIEMEPATRIIRPYRMHKEKPHSDIPWFRNRK